MKKSTHKTHYPITDHFDGKRFFLPGETHDKKSWWKVIKMLFSIRKNPWPRKVAITQQTQVEPIIKSNKAVITYINHATHLIQLNGVNILTDPVFSYRVGPTPWLGPKRVRKPGIALPHLPKIDVVLISHNHFDHMNIPSLLKINKRFKPLFIVPLGNQKYLQQVNINHVIELDWWESFDFNTTTKFTLLPAKHWSMREMGKRNEALWGSFWISVPNFNVFFCCDSGYCDYFSKIFQSFGAPNISILPIGAYEPRWFMQEHHLNPEDAVLAHLDLHSHLSIASHHLTFKLSQEKINAPSEGLLFSLKHHNIKPSDFLIPENGETISVNY